MKLIIDIPEKMYHMINAGFYDYGDMNVIIQNGTPIPDNATNGDIIKTLYPNREFINKGDVYWYPLDYLFHEFSPSWWDSPYDPNKTDEEESEEQTE